MSARKRGCFSTRQPPASKPKSASTNCGAWNVPSPLLSAVHTPASPNADNVGPAVASNVGEEARVLLHPPTTGFEPEVRQHELRIGEESATIAEGRPHSGVAEADDVRAAFTGDVGEEARVPIDQPSARSVPVRALLDLAEVTGAKEDGEVVGVAA